MHLKCGIRATTMHVTSGAICVCTGTVCIARGAVGGQLVKGENNAGYNWKLVQDD